MNNTIKTSNTWPIVLVALVFLFNSSLLQAENITGGRAVITALNTKWNKAFNSGDPESVAALYNENAILSLVTVKCSRPGCNSRPVPQFHTEWRP